MDLTPIDPKTLETGNRLSRSLFTRYGAKLLGRGVVLTAGQCSTLRSMPRGSVFMADSLEDLRRGHLVRRTDVRSIGSTSTSDLLSAGGVVIAEAGDDLEEHHVDASALGLYRGPALREPAAHRRIRLSLADEQVARQAPKWARVPMRIEPSEYPFELPDRDDGGWPQDDRLASERRLRVDRFRQLFAHVLAGVPTEVGEALVIVDDLMDKLRRYPMRFAQIALYTPRLPEYLPDHCFTTACLSVAIAARLRWSAENVRLAGLSGLLADVGMGLVSKEIRRADRKLDDAEVNRVLRHATHSVVLLNNMVGLPESVKLAAYQHHERENGDGYPNRVRSDRITDLGRVTAVADAYSAATEPRPYRDYRLPYDALEELIMLGSQGVLDRRIVRALAESTGLFPVGSYVRLSSGDLAQVCGAPPGQIDRPLVSIVLSTRSGVAPGDLIDLRAFDPWDLSVISASGPPLNHLRHNAA